LTIELTAGLEGDRFEGLTEEIGWVDVGASYWSAEIETTMWPGTV